jgi:transposase-like protein
MALRIERKDNRFRVEGQGLRLDWLADTRANRKAVVVFLRLLSGSDGQPLFPHQQLAKIVGSSNRQASSRHVELFCACGRDFMAFVRHQRKVDDSVVQAVLTQLHENPLATVGQLKEKVNCALGVKHLSEANIAAALEQISAKQMRRLMAKQLKTGKAHYKEEYLLAELMSQLDKDTDSNRQIATADGVAMAISDPTAIGRLVNPDAQLSEVASPLKWISFIMALYYHGVPLSVCGKWFNVHKTTVLRWILGLTLSLWPLVSDLLTTRVKGTIVYIDEKWIKIRGEWYYWFVVLDQQTALPIFAQLLKTRSRWACRSIGCQLKRLKIIPQVIITDGLSSYRYLLQSAKHITCLFHHQQGVSRWLKQNFTDEKEIAHRKPLMKRIFQTNDKRTVKRRLDTIKNIAQSLGIAQWVQQTEQDLQKLLPAVGSQRLPATTNAIERFFRAFNRFYKVRCGFFSLISAKRELIFFLVMYLFVQLPHTGKAPIEAIIPTARGMPFYQFVNQPLKTVFGGQNVNQKVTMADFQPQHCMATQI